MVPVMVTRGATGAPASMEAPSAIGVDPSVASCVRIATTLITLGFRHSLPNHPRRPFAGVKQKNSNPRQDTMAVNERPRHSGNCDRDASGACEQTHAADAEAEPSSTRRQFLAMSAAVGASLAAGTACNDPVFQEYFQKHYLQLTEADKKRIFERLEKEVERTKGVRVKISDPRPLPNVQFAYALNLSVCNGNRRCVEACARENNLPDHPQIRYIRVIELDNVTHHLERGNVYYDREKVPEPGKYYLPVQCHQCKNPPCVKACPTKATWKEPDGIVVIDYNWCIGCRYCQAACPYLARRFNFAKPNVRPDKINPDQGYLSNRLRPDGSGREMHVLPASNPQRPVPRLPRSLPHGRPQIRRSQ